MEDYTESYSRMETLINATQSIKEILICRICLQIFKEPVTLRCGHKFCRDCILELTNINAYAKCPFCKIKIQKRSIPVKGNSLLQSCVEKFNALVQAINNDSGIDVLHASQKLKKTCENVPLSEIPSNSKIEETSNTSTSSSATTNPKLKFNSQKRGKLRFTDLKQPKTLNNLRNNKKTNALHRQLSNKSNCIPDKVIHTSEKVEHWLKNVSPGTECETYSDSNENDSSRVCPSKGIDMPDLDTDSKDSTTKKFDKSKYKETQSRIQEPEIIVKKNKSNLIILDKSILKTPSSVPAASHSDATDWHRLKKVGKEMQPKMFKSLHIKIEKNLSSSALSLDDTVPYDSLNSSNISPELNKVDQLSNDVPKTKTQLSKTNNNCEQTKDSISTIINDSIDVALDMHKTKNNCANSVDKNETEVTEISSMQNILNTPEKTRNVSNMLNGDSLKPNQLSTLNRTNESFCDNQFSEEESNVNTKIIVNNLQTSPKHRFSLKKELVPTISKFENSQYNMLVKLNETDNYLLTNSISEKPKSRLSLRLSTPKSSACITNNTKSPVKGNCFKNRSSLLNCNNKEKKVHSPRRNFVTFRKLGSICKKRKCIPFLKLSSLKPRDRALFCKNVDKQESCIVIKSNIPVKFDYKSLVKNSNIDSKLADTNINNVSAHAQVKLLSPEKDSQLKYLSIESPHSHSNKKENKDGTDKENKLINNYKQPQSSTCMEIDEFPINMYNKILKPELDFREEVRENNNISENNKVLDDDFSVDNQTKIIKNDCQNVKEIDETSITEQQNLSHLHKKEVHNILNDFYPKSSNISEKDDNDDHSTLLKNNEILNPVQPETKVDEDATSSSSKESTSEDTESRISQQTTDKENSISTTKNKNTYFEQTSKSKSESSFTSEGKSKKSEDNNSVSTNTSSLKNKRKHSESSNDDDDDVDVSFIIGKWCDPAAPVEKKAKVNTTSSDIKNNVNFDEVKKKLSESEGFISAHNENTLVDDCIEYSELNVLQRDSPIDDIIAKVNSFKGNETDSSKLNIVPSTLLSADLFESNNLLVQSRAQASPKISANINSFSSSVSTSSPSKKSDKENLFEVTMIDEAQFDRNKSNLSENSDSSNKENITKNHDITNALSSKLETDQKDKSVKIESLKNNVFKETKNEIFDSERDLYHVSESLLNITQEQLALKKIEKDLLGVDLSAINNKNQDVFNTSDNFSTLYKNTKDLQKNTNTEAHSDSENIAATPVSRRRQIINRVSTKSNSKMEDDTTMFLPEQTSSLIPAVTPVKNTKSYPLSHSTPMVNSLNFENKPSTSRKIILICSGLKSENIKLVQNFARKFNVGFQNNFSMDVTHVVVQTDLETKAGQKTFKYIQGVAFEKYVISFQWIVDCLKQNRLLNEDDDKYEVLDPDTFESGSKRSRERKENIFSEFAFFCVEPFNSFSLSEFKSLLRYNGAIVTTTIQELSLQKYKYKAVILESENLSQKQLSKLKESQGVLISFEWIVDSLSQYQILPLVSYLSETSVEEALAMGFPPEYFVEEDDESQ